MTGKCKTLISRPDPLSFLIKNENISNPNILHLITNLNENLKIVSFYRSRSVENIHPQYKNICPKLTIQTLDSTKKV